MDVNLKGIPQSQHHDPIQSVGQNHTPLVQLF